jgi:hypothetical protein
MFYLVYVTATGEAYSYGSVLADPMPAEFTVRPMSYDETSGVLEGSLMWDADTLAFVQNPNWNPLEPPTD